MTEAFKLILIVLILKTGHRTKLYNLIAAIEILISGFLLWPIAIPKTITNFILIPWLVPKVKTAITKKDE